MKRIVIIGSGNLAEALARAIAASSYTLVQIYARNEERGRRIAGMTGCSYAGPRNAPEEADIYLIAVSDKSIAQVASSLTVGKAVVAHTGGAVDMNEIAGHIVNRGVFYPLQTFTAGRKVDLRNVPIFIEGRNRNTVAVLQALAEELSGRVIEADSAQRSKLHLAAVFACNFTNHMYAIGQKLLEGSGIATDVLNPLILETASKAADSPSAARVQTGPAVRNDFRTKDKHMKMLAASPDLQNLYKNISLNIWETSKKI